MGLYKNHDTPALQSINIKALEGYIKYSTLPNSHYVIHIQ